MGAASSIVGVNPAEAGVIDEGKNILNFVAEKDAGILQSAFAGMGTNEKLLVSIVCSRTKKQLEDVNGAFRRLKNDGTDLHDAIKKECGGNFGDFVATVCKSRGDFLCKLLHKACDGIGTNKKLMNKIFCLSTSRDITAMKNVYEAQNDKPLSDLIRKELDGEHRDVIMHLLLTGRGHSSTIDEALATDQAHRLVTVLEEGCGMLGGMKDEAKIEFAKILCEASPEQMKAVQDAWDREYTKASLAETIKSKMGGELEEACLMLLRDPIDEFCNQVKKAVDGIGTDNSAIISVIGGLEKHAAHRVVGRFQEKHQTDLVQRLKGEIGGDFGDAVVAWISMPDPTNYVEYPLSMMHPGDPQFLVLATQAYNNILQSGAAEGYTPQVDVNAIAQQGGMPMQQQPMGGYPPQQQGYPPQGGMPMQQQPMGGYPPQQQGYPSQGGMPMQQQPMGGYPPQQQGYPPQGGMPMQQPGGVIEVQYGAAHYAHGHQGYQSSSSSESSSDSSDDDETRRRKQAQKERRKNRPAFDISALSEAQRERREKRREKKREKKERKKQKKREKKERKKNKKNH